MPFPILTLIAQFASAVYTPCKDMFLCLKGAEQDVKDLEDNLQDLIADVIGINSRMKTIDQILQGSVSKEESSEYQIVKKQIEIIMNKYNMFITKYQKVTSDIPSAAPELDVLSATRIVDELQQRKPKILTCNFCKIAQLSRDIAKLKIHVYSVCDKVKEDYLIIEKKAEVVQLQHTDNDVPPQSRYVEELLRYLCDHNVKRVGISGQIQVGKTTVLRKLNNQLDDNVSTSNVNCSLKLDAVIWITLPKELDTKEKIVEKIQDEVMERLKLNEETNSMNQKRIAISTYLRQKKYILLIDQVSSYIDLNEVGVQEDHEYGKVVIASSNKKIIKQMTDEVVEIGTLSKADAKKLFQNIYGEIENEHVVIAHNIIESCGGLPPVITLVARHLKDTRSSWYDVKQILQSHTECDDLLSLGNIGNAYKMVYEELQSNNDYLKKCLLYGALFPSQHLIHKDYITECWMAQGFIGENVTQRLRATRDRGETILKLLTDKYLFEWYSDKHVKMPHFCRTMALNQKYPNEENSVIWVPSENKLPTEEIWEKATRMSVISCGIKLPEDPKSGNICTLFLQKMPNLTEVGASFFQYMENLQVLDLYETKIESLPNSVGSLANLVILYLNNCSRLTRLPVEVKNLKKLEFLDIRGTSIPTLPEEIRDMVLLRCLRIPFARIPVGIIRRLQLLEEFTVETGCCSQQWTDSAHNVAVELATLKHLTTLSFHFPTVRSLKKFVSKSESWNNRGTHWDIHTFRSFKFSIDSCKPQHPYDADISLSEKQLRLCTNLCTNEEASSVKEVLTQAKVFELVGHCDVQSLGDFDVENMGILKVCIVEGCTNVLSIVNSLEMGEMKGDISEKAISGIFQCLEKLHLFNLWSLQSIWKGSVFPGSLGNLKVLTLCGCPELVEILHHDLAKALISLKHLKVENCAKLVEIVSHSQDQVDLSNALHKLETIELVNLPELQSIYTSTSMTWESLRKMVTIGCSKLTNLSLILSCAKKLETIKCEASWRNALKLTEKEKQIFDRCEVVVLERPLSIGSSSSGETSGTSRSVNNQASDNIGPGSNNGGDISEELVSSNGGSLQTEIQLMVQTSLR